MRGGLTALAAGALMCTPVAAQTREWMPSEKALAKRLTKVGTWDFAAAKPGPDGNPECRETWFFKRGGTGWVQSGEQRVTLTWRILTLQGRVTDRLLYVTAQASAGGRDCMGKAFDPNSYPRAERGFFVRFSQGDSALICGLAEFQHSFDHTKRAPLAGGREDCWGVITPAPAN